MSTQRPDFGPWALSERDLPSLAGALAQLLRPGDVLCLHGDLGAGKTTLARLIVQMIAGPDTEVPSPTFTLVQTYEDGAVPLWHFDLYRLSRADEILELGWEEARAMAASLVEWPERLGPLLPGERLDILLAAADTPDRRTVTLKPHGKWAARLVALPDFLTPKPSPLSA